MLNKKRFLKIRIKISISNHDSKILIGTLVNIADTVMLGYVSQTAMSASSLANQYTFVLFCYILWYGHRYIRFYVPSTGEKGDKKRL